MWSRPVNWIGLLAARLFATTATRVDSPTSRWWPPVSAAHRRHERHLGKLDCEDGGIRFKGLRDRLFESGRGAQIDLAANADDGGTIPMRNGGSDRIRCCHRPSLVRSPVAPGGSGADPYRLANSQKAYCKPAREARLVWARDLYPPRRTGRFNVDAPVPALVTTAPALTS